MTRRSSFHVPFCFMSWNCIILIEAKKGVKGSNVFKHTYLYSADTDTTLFLRGKRSIKERNMLIYYIFKVFRFEIKSWKSKIADIGVLKCVKVALLGIKCIEMCNDTIKVSVIHSSHNSEKRNEKKSSREHN